MKISNPRDLVAHLLGQLLYVERRLADSVLAQVTAKVDDPGLRALLEQHRAETVEHVKRAESAFLRLGMTWTSNLSRPFESAVSEHADLASQMVDPRLADIVHAQAALHVEHWEIATYRTLLTAAPRDVAETIRPSLADEVRAADSLAETIERLGDS